MRDLGSFYMPSCRYSESVAVHCPLSGCRTFVLPSFVMLFSPEYFMSKWVAVNKYMIIGFNHEVSCIGFYVCVFSNLRFGLHV